MLIPVLMFIFSLNWYHLWYVPRRPPFPFYALLAATMMAADFDPMVGAATVLLGAGCGLTASAPRLTRFCRRCCPSTL